MILRINSPQFVATAEWIKIGGEWRCIYASPIIHWIRNDTPEEVQEWLDKRGLKHEWQK